jgi:ferredoxin-NADP reductase
MPYSATILSNSSASPSVFLLKVAVSGEPAFNFKAGQFVVVPLPLEAGLSASGKALKGFYSIASAEQSPAELELLIEHRADGGPVSAWMSSRQPGDSFEVQGPQGHFALAEVEAKGQAFLSFRAGVAPLRSMIHSALAVHGTRHVWLFLGAAGTADLLLDAEWRALEKADKHFHYIPVVQPTAENPFFGKNSDPADELLKRIAQRNGIRVYMAGFNKDVDAMQAKLLAGGFVAEDIKVEKFG